MTVIKIFYCIDSIERLTINSIKKYYLDARLNIRNYCKDNEQHESLLRDRK